MTNVDEDRLRFATEEILAQGNLEFVDEFFAPNYVAHIGGMDGKGPQFVKRFSGLLRSSFPDLRVVNVEVLLQGADTIAWQRTLSGTHAAELMGIPPRGKKIEWHDMLVSRFDGEQVAEDWAISELAGQLLMLPARN